MTYKQFYAIILATVFTIPGGCNGKRSIDGNGDDVIQVPEILYNASFSETQSIINIDTSFFVENANDEIFMSLVGVYEEAVDASVSAIRDVLPNQWQSDYLHIAYKGYTAESQAWANYNGISSSNS